MIRAALALALVATCAGAGPDQWSERFDHGYREAWEGVAGGDLILVACDVGDGGGSFIAFDIAGAPVPGSTVTLTFDDRAPEDVSIWENGTIPSDCRACASNFDWVVARLKHHGQVGVRTETGAEAWFTLFGSARAIGTCVADFHK